ncbi:hypothetical protein PV392_29155 [Streptomyces sp. ME03-5709C]|nr:hypothetical protein [Streptomyces sp. ME03-5709C]
MTGRAAGKAGAVSAAYAGTPSEHGTPVRRMGTSMRRERCDSGDSEKGSTRNHTVREPVL